MKNGELAEKYNVSSIPTLTIIKNGEIVLQKAGPATKESLKTIINNSMN